MAPFTASDDLPFVREMIDAASNFPWTGGAVVEGAAVVAGTAAAMAEAVI